MWIAWGRGREEVMWGAEGTVWEKCVERFLASLGMIKVREMVFPLTRPLPQGERR
jgi:hypothetical protein